MADDYPARGNFRRNLGQDPGDILVRQPMKAVTPDAFVVISARQREQVGHFRVIPVKSRVEARDLRDLRVHGPRRLDVIQVVRQMQRCEWTQSLQRFDHLIVDDDGRVEFEAAVHDPVSHASHRGAADLSGRPADQETEQEVDVDAAGVFPVALLEKLAFFVFRDEARAAAEAFDLARYAQGQGLLVDNLEDRKLQARGTAV
jgi:hypothetical protein